MTTNYMVWKPNKYNQWKIEYDDDDDDDDDGDDDDDDDAFHSRKYSSLARNCDQFCNKINDCMLLVRMNIVRYDAFVYMNW